jgi:hypothetical protein
MTKTITIVRWICLLPGAMLGCCLVYLLAMILIGFSISWYIEPGSFLSRILVVSFSHGATGFAFLYVGEKIAPSHKNLVIYSLAGIVLIVSGFLAYPAVLVSDYWAILGNASLIAGSLLSVGQINPFLINSGKFD